jgi:peptide/nickel transport system permease protein
MMGAKFVLLWTDAVILGLLLVGLAYVWHVRRDAARRATWRRVFASPAAMGASVVLLAAFSLAVLDSLHYRPRLEGAGVVYDARTLSVLDGLLAGVGGVRETTYSAPLAYQGFGKDAVEIDGVLQRAYPRLQYGGAHLDRPAEQWAGDVARLAAIGLVAGAAVAALGWLALAATLGRSGLPWRTAAAVFALIALAGGAMVALSQGYHVFGTDRTGNDVLVQALKSVRTAFVIGSLSTLATLPLAVGLGIAAGYFKGWVDELIQYLYTLLSSIPNVLLIAACVLMMQVFLDKNPELFETAAERSDLRLFMLCAILGLTGWAGLCRLLRAETLKLRELEYVQAAEAFGIGRWRIMARHIFPNVVHLVLITTVLDFCALILYEAVLSYVGVGVDPSMSSFGGMINLARSEMSRDPVVWWSFAAAFGFMVTLVLAANLFADGVQDAFDPRARIFRPRLKPAQG